MKKLITLTILSSLIFAGSAFAQDDRPVRDGAGDRKSHFRIPKKVRGNEDIQAAVASYREASSGLRETIQGLREQMGAADTDEAKAAIKEQIREQLQAHRADQREFRKAVRKIMRELREARAGDDSGE